MSKTAEEKYSPAGYYFNIYNDTGTSFEDRVDPSRFEYTTETDFGIEIVRPVFRHGLLSSPRYLFRAFPCNGRLVINFVGNTFILNSIPKKLEISFSRSDSSRGIYGLIMAADGVVFFDSGPDSLLPGDFATQNSNV